MSQWFDHSLIVFIIWGVFYGGTFFVLFVCVPGKRVLRKLCRLLGCRCCGLEEEAPPSDDRSVGLQYQMFSTARKQELDSLRASVLSYRLYPCSLTLEEKHMIRRTSVVEGPAASPTADSRPQDRIKDSAGDGEDTETSTSRDGGDPPGQYCTGDGDDVEAASSRGGGDPPESNEEEQKIDVRDSQCTHISVPLPGHNFDCVKILDAGDAGSAKEERKFVKEEKKSKMRTFSPKEVQSEDTKEEPTTEDIDEKRRHCPMFCAICLNEYEISERVSWSSNPECTHVFHEDCVTQWLVSLGRTKSKSQHFSQDPSEAQLLNYDLECPCCRQEFVAIDRAARAEGGGGEESA